ncbi:MAG: DUF933 domain-containing protein [Candidatus Makana argininalis]
MHSDFYKKIIKAQIISYNDFIFYKEENEVKKKEKYV